MCSMADTACIRLLVPMNKRFFMVLSIFPKTPLWYYIAKEMVKACLAILDTVTIWYTVCEFIISLLKKQKMNMLNTE